MAIGSPSSTRITVAFSRGNPREVWKRKVVSDSWVENRNCDLDGIYEWCGYAFFYVKFGPQDGGEAGDDPAARTQGPIPRRDRCRRFEAMEARNPIGLEQVNEEKRFCRMLARLTASRPWRMPGMQSGLVAVRPPMVAQ